MSQDLFYYLSLKRCITDHHCQPFRPEPYKGQQDNCHSIAIYIDLSWKVLDPALNILSIMLIDCVNGPFPSSLVPLFHSESKCETILMKMTLICMKMKLHAELIFI